MTFIEEMYDILKDENKILQKLIEFSKIKTDFLLKGEIKELEELTKEEEKLTNDMKALERLREEALVQRGLSKDTSLLEILDKTGDANPAFVLESEKMINSVSELLTLNDRNKELLNDNLAWVEFNMNLLSQAEIPTVYNKEKSENQVDSSIFNKKV